MEDIKEKTADELMKEIGFEINIDEINNLIEYVDYDSVTTFYLDEEVIDIENHYITKTEAKAIYMKCRELGWI